MGAPGEGDVVRRDGVEVRATTDATGAAAALRFLDAVGSEVDAPLVDEAERARLEALAAGRGEPGHRAALALRDGQAVGYVGVLLGDVAGADVAVPRGRDAAATVGVCLGAAEALARQGGTGRLGVWLRRADPEGVEHAVGRGYGIERRLLVLGCPLSSPPDPVAVPDGVAIRSYRPDEDDAAVVAVLAEAYAGTAEAGWDRERFDEKRRFDWFDPDDLLLAVDRRGAALGLHWTKRRSPEVGEVYNLAVAPRAQGRRLGAALLAAGLRHLHGRGVREVLLWVDGANERAVALYTSHGFAVRWEDVELSRRLD